MAIYVACFPWLMMQLNDIILYNTRIFLPVLIHLTFRSRPTWKAEVHCYFQSKKAKHTVYCNHSTGFHERHLISKYRFLTGVLMTYEPVFKEAEAFLNVLKNTLVFRWNSHMAQYTLLKDEMAGLQEVASHFHHRCVSRQWNLSCMFLKSTDHVSLLLGISKEAWLKLVHAQRHNNSEE